MKKERKPYIQRCMKIITAETAQEAETIVNGLFLDAAQDGADFPQVNVSQNGDHFTIIIFNDVIVT